MKKILDPALFKGETVVDESGEPSRSTSVRRLVYEPSGKLLYDNTWYSSYRGEPQGRPRRDEAEGGEAASEEGAERRERAQRADRRRRR